MPSLGLPAACPALGSLRVEIPHSATPASLQRPTQGGRSGRVQSSPGVGHVRLTEPAVLASPDHHHRMCTAEDHRAMLRRHDIIDAAHDGESAATVVTERRRTDPTLQAESR